MFPLDVDTPCCYLLPITYRCVMCAIEGCDRKSKARGLCAAHYRRLQVHGDPLGGGRSLARRGAPMAWLLEHVDYDSDDCLIWPFQRDKDGYAAMSRRRPCREMCERAHGPVPFEKAVTAHSCGNGHLGCINPKHLRWATQKVNVADKIAHGTHQAREAHGRAKLTEKDIQRIRALRGELPQWRIGEIFGVSQTNVSSIQRGETWR